LNELRGYKYELVSNQRIMNDEITSGADILGALLMGHPYNSWWTGSDLSIEESRKLVPHQNATTMQVAISVVAAVLWMIKNPDQGFKVPDELPHDFVLEISKPYLGKWISTPSDWTPLQDREITLVLMPSRPLICPIRGSSRTFWLAMPTEVAKSVRT